MTNSLALKVKYDECNYQLYYQHINTVIGFYSAGTNVCGGQR